MAAYPFVPQLQGYIFSVTMSVNYTTKSLSGIRGGGSGIVFGGGGGGGGGGLSGNDNYIHCY